jgi:hypothetical protein
MNINYDADPVAPYLYDKATNNYIDLPYNPFVGIDLKRIAAQTDSLLDMLDRATARAIEARFLESLRGMIIDDTDEFYSMKRQFVLESIQLGGAAADDGDDIYGGGGVDEPVPAQRRISRRAVVINNYDEAIQFLSQTSHFLSRKIVMIDMRTKVGRVHRSTTVSLNEVKEVEFQGQACIQMTVLFSYHDFVNEEYVLSLQSDHASFNYKMVIKEVNNRRLYCIAEITFRVKDISYRNKTYVEIRADNCAVFFRKRIPINK